MKTLREFKNEKRRRQRKEFKYIESILHPTPKIGGCDILHEHLGQYIIFSAWKGDSRKSYKQLEFHRQDILFCPEGYDFYGEQKENLKWLCEA